MLRAADDNHEDSSQEQSHTPLSRLGHPEAGRWLISHRTAILRGRRQRRKERRRRRKEEAAGRTESSSPDNRAGNNSTSHEANDSVGASQLSPQSSPRDPSALLSHLAALYASRRAAFFASRRASKNRERRRRRKERLKEAREAAKLTTSSRAANPRSQNSEDASATCRDGGVKGTCTSSGSVEKGHVSAWNWERSLKPRPQLSPVHSYEGGFPTSMFKIQHSSDRDNTRSEELILGPHLLTLPTLPPLSPSSSPSPPPRTPSPPVHIPYYLEGTIPGIIMEKAERSRRRILASQRTFTNTEKNQEFKGSVCYSPPDFNSESSYPSNKERAVSFHSTEKERTVDFQPLSQTRLAGEQKNTFSDEKYSGYKHTNMERAVSLHSTEEERTIDSQPFYQTRLSSKQKYPSTNEEYSGYKHTGKERAVSLHSTQTERTVDSEPFYQTRLSSKQKYPSTNEEYSGYKHTGKERAVSLHSTQTERTVDSEPFYQMRLGGKRKYPSTNEEYSDYTGKERAVSLHSSETERTIASQPLFQTRLGGKRKNPSTDEYNPHDYNGYTDKKRAVSFYSTESDEERNTDYRSLSTTRLGGQQKYPFTNNEYDGHNEPSSSTSLGQRQGSSRFLEMSTRSKANLLSSTSTQRVCDEQTSCLPQNPTFTWSGAISMGERYRSEGKRLKNTHWQHHTRRNVVAMDCEMVGCQPRPGRMMIGKRGKMIKEVSVAGRCTIVDYDGSVVYDSFVKPDLPILDLRTFVSGITARDMARATPIQQAREEIADILRDKIVVAHDIRHDLAALDITLPPDNIRDTSSSPQLCRRANLPHAGTQRQSLRNLASHILGRDIQRGCHSSLEDAQVAMQLYRHVELEWESS